MITTTLPAQITSVEDRVTRRLTVTQFALLSAPLLLGCFVFILLPPFFGFNIYKLIVIIAIASLCGILAIRIKGKILLHHLFVFSKFYLRPRYYVYTKNTLYLKEAENPRKNLSVPNIVSAPETTKVKSSKITVADFIRSEDKLNSLASDGLEFRVGRKGEMYAVIKSKS